MEGQFSQENVGGNNKLLEMKNVVNQKKQCKTFSTDLTKLEKEY